MTITNQGESVSSTPARVSDHRDIALNLRCIAEYLRGLAEGRGGELGGAARGTCGRFAQDLDLMALVLEDAS